jgi:hypothetical protein
LSEQNESVKGNNLWARKNQFRKSCENKEQFFTKKTCELRINNLNKNLNEVGLVPYNCPFCGWWHYGHEIGLETKIKGDTE